MPPENEPEVEGATQAEEAFVSIVNHEPTEEEEALLNFVIDDDVLVSDPVIIDFSNQIQAAAQPLTDIASLTAPLTQDENAYIDKIRADLADAAQSAAAVGADQQQAVTKATVDILDNIPDDADPALVAIIKNLQDDNSANHTRIQKLEENHTKVLEEKRIETKRRQRATFDAATATGQFRIADDIKDVAYEQIGAIRQGLHQAPGKNTTLKDVLVAMQGKMPGLFTPNDPAAIKVSDTKPTPERKVAPKAPPKTPSGANEPIIQTPKAQAYKKPENLKDCAKNMLDSFYSNN